MKASYKTPSSHNETLSTKPYLVFSIYNTVNGCCNDINNHSQHYTCSSLLKIYFSNIVRSTTILRPLTTRNEIDGKFVLDVPLVLL